MIEEQEIGNIAKETLEILKFFSKNFIFKIPKHTIDELEQLSKYSFRDKRHDSTNVL